MDGFSDLFSLENNQRSFEIKIRDDIKTMEKQQESKAKNMYKIKSEERK